MKRFYLGLPLFVLALIIATAMILKATSDPVTEPELSPKSTDTVTFSLRTIHAPSKDKSLPEVDDLTVNCGEYRDFCQYILDAQLASNKAQNDEGITSTLKGCDALTVAGEIDGVKIVLVDDCNVKSHYDLAGLDEEVAKAGITWEGFERVQLSSRAEGKI